MVKPAKDIRPAPLTTVTVRLPESDVDQIDKFAEKFNLSRSEMLRNIFQVGLDELRALDRVGAVGAFTSFRSFAAWIREKGLLPDREKDEIPKK